MFKKIVFLLFMITSVAYADDKAIVDKINAQHAQIRSLTCDTQIIIARRALKLTLDGKFYYEIEKNFRLINHSAVDGKYTSDIGSNNKYFWVYAKRLNPNYLIYSDYSELQKTNLHTSLDPTWMLECFNFGQIDTRKASINRQGDNIVVTQGRISPRRQIVYKLTMIDPTKPAVIANYLYDSNSRQIAYAKVTSFHTTTNNMYFPKTMKAGSVDEEAILFWTFSNLKFNPKISSDTWNIPELSVQKIDLSTGITVRGLND